MTNTVEFGGWRPPPRWVWAIVGVAAVAVVAGVVVGRAGPHRAGPHSAAASARPEPPSSPPWPPRGAHTPGAGSAAAWPSAAGDCGAPIYLPQIRLASQRPRVRGTVLVGGTALRQVFLSSAVYRALPGLRDQGLLVTKLVPGPGVDYAFVAPQCSGYLWVYRILAGAAHRLGTTADDLLGGPRHAWAVTYRSHTVLTPLNGGRAVTLKKSTDPIADTAAGLVVLDSSGAGRASTAELIDSNSGAPPLWAARGYPMGATGQVVLVSLPGCRVPSAGRACALRSIDLMTGQPMATFVLPTGRVPVSDAVFSRGGTTAAFQLARARQDPRFATGRPFPSDVAVLHLETGRLDIVPGLELPPGARAGLAFDGTGRWLLVTVSEGDRGELLAWRPGMPGPALVTGLPGPFMAAPPLLLTPSSWRSRSTVATAAVGRPHARSQTGLTSPYTRARRRPTLRRHERRIR